MKDAWLTKTPVLIWADLPPDKRLADDPEEQRSRLPVLPPDIRCVARSRGNTGTAHIRSVPMDGGYRCQRRAQMHGLCWRHYNRATPAIRRRASELVAKEIP